MNPSVVVVTADRTCQHVIDVITEFGVSGVPVVRDDDRVIGIISEADLLPRLHPADAAPSAGEPPEVHRKAEAHTAGDLMTAPPVTVTAGSLVSTAAGLMEQHRVKRLPVLDDDTGILVGIVTRRDLLRGALRSDETIEREIMEELLVHGLWFERAGITAAVQDGVVTLSGSAEHRRDALTVVSIADAVDGVAAVVDNIIATSDAAPVGPAGLTGTACG
ncbi:CBS domain-containing protein [Dactylosporangium sp. NBC_01737]|uniref:CBS domain-containing protein n=1 Tax=Dactylosporangium sp. NBC_01737 TaxID=2975959 RepID=UPI002E15BA31|nr:CBS domain-containing protein [Dactylosporangium sp. NBC_01737]